MTPVGSFAKMSVLPRSTIDVLGIRVDSISRRGLIRSVEDFVASGSRSRVMYANAHVLNVAYHDSDLRRILNQADLVYCDGAGVKVGTRLLGYHLPERMTGADWIHDLCQACQETGMTLYLLGGEPGVAAAAAKVLTAHYPGLSVVGTHHGHYDHDGPENGAVIAEINALHPDILLVGFGTPLQEKWIDRHFERLQVPVVWAVGALVDFVTAKKPRAPHWMLDHGLEWLYRLWSEPGRLWKRYVVGNPVFIWRVFMQRLGWLHLE
jgi:N-acetylglucosaminyldiphosphoundecaprenol N-acetyl-beta-D-mannosaminyltransferase